ncbi:hypothetical protein [Kribbella sp.]|uniref:hypothetical protein n=1 Tax=Kribbella sp. TaxID=1871183 RepID=UPI002D7A2C37|nr:hypothetical protein [Kribbella sp.]
MSRMKPRRFKARKAITATAVVAAVATTALTGPFASAAENDPEAAQTCALQILPIPEGLVSTKVTGMSRDGSVIAYQADPPSTGDPDAAVVRYPLLYADGKVTKVPMPGEWQEIADVNSKGVGAGNASVNDAPLPYVWRDGKLTRLLGGRGWAYGINETGDIVGKLWPAPGSDDPTVHPTVWRSGTTNPVKLPLPKTANGGSATAIANDGRIIGEITLNNDPGEAKPYIWYPDGTGKLLPMPEGVDLADADVHPMEINGDWVSGILFAPGIEAPGIRWNLAKGTAEMTKLGRDWETVAVGPDGTAVGVLYNTPIAAYQTGGTVFELPGVLDPDANINWDNAEAISADGSLIAGTAWAGNDWNAVTWTCK